MEEGQELLIVDGDPRVLQGMERLFSQEGFLVTSLQDGNRAMELAYTKFFPVVLLEFQVPNQSGLQILQEFQRISPQSNVIFLTKDPDLDLCLEAFRKGAFDVIRKDRSQVPYLKEQVKAACHTFDEQSKSAQTLLRETLQILEELVSTMVEIAKRNLLLEGTESIVAAARMNILIADPNPDLTRLFSGKQGLSITHCTGGGEALDHLTQYQYELVLVVDRLPDLPASVVIRQAKSKKDTIVFLFDNFQGGQGRFKTFHRGKETKPEIFQTPIVLLQRIEEMQQRRSEIVRERRAVESVTRKNFQLFKRYGEIRERLSRVIEVNKS